MKQTALRLYRTYVLPYKKYIFITAAFALVVIVLTGGDSATESTEEVAPILVSVGTPAELSGAKSTELIGTVSAKTQADLQTEVSGRITSVAVSLGQRVSAGQIIATIENASERASVLQAEGAYEAAQAAAASGNVGTREAEIRLADARVALQAASDSSYGTAQNVLFNTLDSFFANPTGLYPTLRISVYDQGDYLRSERKAFQEYLPRWTTLRFTEDTVTANTNAVFVIEKLDTLLAMTDALTTGVNHFRNDQRYTDEERSANLAKLSTARAQILATRSSFSNAVTALKVAEESLDRAQIASSGGTASLADAQLKQALGALRATEANLAKTIIRTPIAGEVNSVSVKAGDFVGAFTPVALIANNQGLEITTYIGTAERDLLSVGDELLIEGAGTGTVTNISPAIDAATGKIEVRVAVSASTLQNGDRVRLFIQEIANEAVPTIQVPLAAIKFDGSDAYVFKVVENILERQMVELGAIRGDRVVIISGIDNITQIVRDARGLVAGTEVTVVTK